MATKQTIEKVVDETPSTGMKTFYVFSQENELRQLPTGIYSPFNIGRKDDTNGNAITYDNPTIYLFNKGVFETDDPKAIEFLTYLATGISPVTGTNILSNGKKVNIDVVNRIRMEKPKPKTTTTVVTNTVEIQVIPRVIAENLTIEQLTSFCTEWKVPLPEFKDGNVKESIITTLENTGHIK